MAKFELLIGQTLKAVTGATKGSKEIVFTLESDLQYSMYHDQDCCESVSIAEVHGDIADLLNTPVLIAYVESSHKGKPLPPRADWETDPDDGYRSGSWTWTFYRIATIKGSVTLRWFGESNGYYSESVSFRQVGADYWDDV